MDGENHGKPYDQMDDLGGFNPLFSVQHPVVSMIGVILGSDGSSFKPSNTGLDSSPCDQWHGLPASPSFLMRP